jgi:hypothetical protein
MYHSKNDVTFKIIFKIKYYINDTKEANRVFRIKNNKIVGV